MDLVVEQLDRALRDPGAQEACATIPFLMGQGVWMDSEKLGWDDEVREVLKHGTLSVGFIGLAETLKALIGEHHGESAERAAAGLEDHRPHARAHATRRARRSGLNYTLLATPGGGPFRPLRASIDREALRRQSRA